MDALILKYLNINMANLSMTDKILTYAILGVSALIIICCVVALIIKIVLGIIYMVYNKKKASCGLQGKDIARKLLDDNGLENIDVSCVGSIMFGNSYSHFFKKVRLRRFTWEKDTITSMAMASQKSMLAVLDKEGDKDMKVRIWLTPFIYFGPMMLIPLIVVGAIIDILLYKTIGKIFVCFVIIGLGTYIISFIMSIKVLKTEKKAQEKALEVVKISNIANESEIVDMKKLFKLYNIEYVINIIVTALELLLRILNIINVFKGNKKTN